MAADDQVTQLSRALLAYDTLSVESLRTIDLAKRLGIEPRATQRILAAIREAGERRRAAGQPWPELVTEVRGAERWHRVVDHAAEPKKRGDR